MVQLGVESLS